MNALEEFAHKFNIEQGLGWPRKMVFIENHYEREESVNVDGRRYKVTRATLYEPIENKE